MYLVDPHAESQESKITLEDNMGVHFQNLVFLIHDQYLARRERIRFRSDATSLSMVIVLAVVED